MHAIVMAAGIGFLTGLALDLDAYVKFRTENKGASYDWQVAIVRCIKGAIAAGLAAAGVKGVGVAI